MSNNIHQFFNKLYYSKAFENRPLEKIILNVLTLCSFIYLIGLKIHQFLYRLKILPVDNFPKIKVISIGNITLGGTGKTPFTILLAKHLSNHYRTAIVSRGYRGRLKNKSMIVSLKGEMLCQSPELCGDEPYFMATKLDHCSIAVGKKRSNALRHVLKYAPDINLAILDDGFQHYAVYRDLDIVLIDGLKVFGNNTLFPRGPLREPISALDKAGFIIILFKQLIQPPQDIINRVLNFIPPHYPRERILISTISITGVTDMNNKHYHINSLEDKRIGLFAGIASPHEFFDLISLHPLDIMNTVAFQDHHMYNIESVTELNQWMEKYSLDYAITTEKDIVKLYEYKEMFKVPILSLGIEINCPIEPIIKSLTHA